MNSSSNLDFKWLQTFYWNVCFEEEDQINPDVMSPRGRIESCNYDVPVQV